MGTNIVEIYCLADEFSKNFDSVMLGHTLQKDSGKRSRNRKFTLSDSEAVTILILFHLKQFRNLKAFYTQYIQVHCRNDFPHTVSYNRFVELQQKTVVNMTLFLQLCCPGKCTGVSFTDSTPLRVCHIQREHGHRTFKGLVSKGKSTAGRFFGFKLHILINDRGEILDFVISRANTDDREPLKNKRFHE
ncbi:MAG: transposase, partial [Tannerella sp.]|nr:transposase [Tannerella sp.]